MKRLILATRGSALALAQAAIVKRALEEKGTQVQISEVSTKGDKNRKTPLRAIGGSGLFVREIEKELITRRADIAVHSAKDLPYELSDGLAIAAVPEAASSADILLTRKGENVRPGFVIGTGSARRVLQAGRLYHDCIFKDIRGNVDTRLQKLLGGQYDAVILAKAGLDRLNVDLSDFDEVSFDLQNFVPAACQGIIAVECRESDKETRSILETITHEETKKRFDAERYMLSLLKADCSAAIGVNARIDGEKIIISALFGEKKTQREGAYKNYKQLCQEIRDEIYE